MSINKITTGYLIQTWDTELKKWISQEFVADDQTEYEQVDGDRADPIEPHEVWPGWPDTEPYLPVEIRQPAEMVPGAPRFYVFETLDDVEPQLHGPFLSAKLRDAQAIELRRQDPDKDNGLFRLDLSAAAELEAGSYCGGELE